MTNVRSERREVARGHTQVAGGRGEVAGGRAKVARKVKVAKSQQGATLRPSLLTLVVAAAEERSTQRELVLRQLPTRLLDSARRAGRRAANRYVERAHFMGE